MLYNTLLDERSNGAKLTQRSGYTKTAETIRNKDRCYEEIMLAFVEEAGIDQAVALVAHIGFARWAYRFARHTPGLTETHHDTLVTMIAKSGAREYAAWYATDISGLTEEQLRLLRITAKIST